MPEEGSASDQEAILARYQDLDLSASDTESILRKVDALKEIAVYLHERSLEKYGGPPGFREEGALEQAIAAAFQTFGDFNPYPGDFQKAAVLLRGISRGHAFVDGNKRAAWQLTAYYLAAMGYGTPPPFDIDLVERFCKGIASGEVNDLEAIEAQLHEWWGV
jgi:prophage maintenance system killer protein